MLRRECVWVLFFEVEEKKGRETIKNSKKNSIKKTKGKTKRGVAKGKNVKKYKSTNKINEVNSEQNKPECRRHG